MHDATWVEYGEKSLGSLNLYPLKLESFCPEFFSRQEFDYRKSTRVSPPSLGVAQKICTSFLGANGYSKSGKAIFLLFIPFLIWPFLLLYFWKTQKIMNWGWADGDRKQSRPCFFSLWPGQRDVLMPWEEEKTWAVCKVDFFTVDWTEPI